MINTIVFDMGNVLIRYAPTEFIKSFTEDETSQQLLLDAIFLSDEWLDYDSGTITKEKLIATAQDRVPEDLKPSIPRLMDTWFENMMPIAGMEEILHKLRSNGYQLLLLSNVSQDFHQFKAVIPGIELFDGLFLSSDWKCIKPDTVIYEQFFAHFDLNPADCFFIDDLAMNIEGAAKLGMTCHVFDGDLTKLEDSFKKAGILLS